MKKCFYFLTLALFVSTIALAQSDRQPKKYDNPQWKRVVMIDFLPGKMGRAMTIIKDYYEKASKKAGTPSPEMSLVMASGEYDMMTVWGMKGGLEEMNWDTSPNDIAWFKALSELAGGDAKATALRQEYSSLINRSTSYIARVSQ